jgi:hypothetical protein
MLAQVVGGEGRYLWLRNLNWAVELSVKLGQSLALPRLNQTTAEDGGLGTAFGNGPGLSRALLNLRNF